MRDADGDLHLATDLQGVGRRKFNVLAADAPVATPPLPPMSRGAQPDYDDEARKLWSSLGLDALGQGVPARHSYNALDAIYRDASTGGVVYVGNQTAASSRKVQQDHNITHVVNCTDNMPNYHEAAAGGPIYLRFNISYWFNAVDGTPASVLAFTAQVFDFVEAAVASGGAVLIHCLAGAHRAGTTGVLCLMRKTGLDRKAAVAAAKKLRPAIDPIGSFPELLKRYEEAKDPKAGRK